MVWAVFYSGLVECVAMWVLCVNCGMGCRLPVASRLLRIGAPEALGSACVGVLASGPLW